MIRIEDDIQAAGKLTRNILYLLGRTVRILVSADNKTNLVPQCMEVKTKNGYRR